MKLTNFFVATTFVIAATLKFGVQGSPRPQLNNELGSTNVLSLDPLGILFGRPTSESLTSSNDPSLHETNPTFISNPPTESPAVDSTQVPRRIQSDVDLCAQNCRFQGTSEYNPVCGSDGIVYNNPGYLICARNCGLDVMQRRTGRCPPPSPTVTPKPPTPTPETPQPDATQCARNCIVTPEYNPVCGSDGVTYRNAGLLICTRNCGINVTQRSYGPCIIEDHSR